MRLLTHFAALAAIIAATVELGNAISIDSDSISGVTPSAEEIARVGPNTVHPWSENPELRERARRRNVIPKRDMVRQAGTTGGYAQVAPVVSMGMFKPPADMVAPAQAAIMKPDLFGIPAPVSQPGVDGSAVDMHQFAAQGRPMLEQGAFINVPVNNIDNVRENFFKQNGVGFGKGKARVNGNGNKFGLSKETAAGQQGLQGSKDGKKPSVFKLNNGPDFDPRGTTGPLNTVDVRHTVGIGHKRNKF